MHLKAINDEIHFWVVTVSEENYVSHYFINFEVSHTNLKQRR